MVASYTPNLRITKQGDNDNPNTWGQVTNNQVITMFEEAISGVAIIDISGSSDIDLYTTVNNGSTDDARHAVLELIGTIGADIDLVLPAVEKIYLIRAAYSGAFDVTVKPIGASSGIVFDNTKTGIVYTNGTNIYEFGGFLEKDQNLSDLVDIVAARTNLGLGALATQSAADIVGDGLQEDTGNLEIKLAASSGLAVDTNGLRVDIESLATDTGVDVVNDQFAYNDVTDGVTKKSPINDLIQASLLSKIGFNSFFVSAQQTPITQGSQVTLPHGLARIPVLATVEFVCLTANNGFSVGQKVTLCCASFDSAVQHDIGYQVQVDATNVSVTIADDSLAIMNPTTGDIFAFGNPNTNFAMVIRCWA